MTSPLLSFSRTTGDVLPVSLDRLIESRLLIQANSGGGKSRAIRYLLEQTYGRVQHIVLDREGEFSTLREKFAYALAGPGGETAADVRSAKILARKTLELGFSLIVDLSEMTLPQQRQYIKAFLDSLNHLPRDLWKDCLIIIDEAHLFAPESGKGDGTALEAIALLLSTGRKRGYCAVLATQRIAKLSKDVAAECLNKMIGRTSEEDVKRAAEEVGMARAEAKSLRSLDPGHFWTYGPAIGTDPVLARTGDVRTAPPKRGALREPAPPTPSAIKRLLADLADLPVEAVHEEADRSALLKRIAELEGEKARLTKLVAEKPSATNDPSEIRRLTEHAVARALVDERKRSDGALDLLSRTVARLADGVKKEVVKARASADQLERSANELEVVATSNTRKARGAVQLDGEKGTGDSTILVSAVGQSSRAPARPIATAPTSTGGSLPKGEQLVLTAVAQYPDGAERDQLSILTGYKRSTRDAYIQRLAEKGYVESRGALVLASQEGVDALGDSFTPLPTGDALQAYWLDRLPEGERRILAVLLEQHPDVVSRDVLSEATNYKRSTRDAYIQRLGTRRLIETTGGGVRASAVFFE
jgi:hypothetical protein